MRRKKTANFIQRFSFINNEIFKTTRYQLPGPKAGMALEGNADINRHALLNTRKLPVYSTCRLCQKIQTLNLLAVVQGQCRMECAADESGIEDEIPAT
jgi:hypothetical protein